MSSPLRAGTIIAGRYRLSRLLGSGGMGVVWVGDRLDGRGEVAIKFLLQAFAEDPRLRARFEKEARVALSLESPHLVRVLEWGFANELPFMVMERLVGEDLARRLRSRTRLPLPEVAALVSGIARGVAAAHARGLVHRDLKPANVFLARVGDAEIPKILDFGVVKAEGLGVTAATKPGEVVGTPKYMAPEQLRMGKDVDERADLWSIGVIAFAAATGRVPFDAPNVLDQVVAVCKGPIPSPSQVLPGLPPAFDAWFARACSRELEGRFSTARELAAELERVVTGAGPAAPAQGPRRLAERVVRAAPRPGALAGAVPAAGSAPSASSPGSGPAPSPLASLAAPTLVDPPAARGGAPAWLLALLVLLFAATVLGAAAAVWFFVLRRP